MKILLAVDGSEHSARAQDLLLRVAGRNPHRVTVLHVTLSPGKFSGDEEKVFLQTLSETGLHMVRRISEEVQSASAWRVAPLMISAKQVAPALLGWADRQRVDLITLGARGLTPFKAFLLGSVSQRVARHARGAVLIARGESPEGLPRRPLKVLAALDGSASSRNALRFLPELGDPRQMSLTLLTVIEPPLVLASPGMDLSNMRYFEQSLKDNRVRAQRLLAHAEKKSGHIFGQVKPLAVEGYAAGEILRVTTEGEYDLVLLGKRGLSPLKAFFLGSVSQKVSTHAPCSVLMVPRRRK